MFRFEIFMVTMQVGSYFPNITNKVKKKKCVELVFCSKFLLLCYVNLLQSYNLVTDVLDSFNFKFKNLLHAEKDVILTIKSEAGQAHVSLSQDLGHVHTLPFKCSRNPRNG